MNSQPPKLVSPHPIAHVVVLGGSIAGLLAACAAARSGLRVTVLERDRPDAASTGPRKGIPQGRHAHLLLQRGLDVLEELLPGIGAELDARHGPAIDTIRDTLWKVDGRLRPRFPSRYRSYAVSRPELEALVRRRVEALDGVRFAYGETVTGLVLADGRVSGVQLARGSVVSADLTIDASGRGTRVPAWLGAAGYAPLPTDSAPLELRYTSCVVQPTADFRSDYRVLLVPPRLPHCPRGGLLLPIEHGRYLATLIGYGEGAPARDFATFRERAAQIDDPALAVALSRCEPLSEPASYEIPSQTWRRYDRATRLPAGLLAIGDAVCGFDPAFGQGMSVCALEARLLWTLLRARTPLERLTGQYFGASARIVAGAWSLTQARPAPARLKPSRRVDPAVWLRRYQRALLRAAADSPALHLAFVRVVNLEAPPSSLLAPSIAARVLAHRLRAQAG